jgi:acetyl-CoA carboxylase carboxyltransferase component
MVRRALVGVQPKPDRARTPTPTEHIHATRVHVPGNVRSGTELLGGRLAVVVRTTPGRNRGALSLEDGITIAEAADIALDRRLPLVMVISSSGADINGGIAAMHGWGVSSAGVARCSGIVPVLAAVTGPAISGPALMLGLVDIVAMTPDAFAFVSGPDMVLEFTGIGIERSGARWSMRPRPACAL